MHRKLLIVGWDSVNWESLQPHLDAGRMPTLKSLIARGASGVLQSTVPAHTAAAWTTLVTGKSPGEHGLLHFHRFDPRTMSRRLNTTHDLQHKTIWQLLDEQGVRVGAVGQPQSYPPRPLQHGFVVSGFETPGTHADFTWPSALKSEILNHAPDFNFKSERPDRAAVPRVFQQLADFHAGVAALRRDLESTHRVNLFLAKSHPWDVLFLYYQQTDILFHKAWRWCDPATRDEDPERARAIDGVFKRLDEMLAELLELPAATGALTLVCSDHGHGPIYEKVRVNGLLAEQGFLHRGSLVHQVRNLLKGKPRHSIQFGMAVDWARTRAYFAYDAKTGFIFLNRKDREPSGIVDSAEAPSQTRELIAKMKTLTSPLSGRPIFDDLQSLETVFPNHGAFDLPDIFAFPAPGISFTRKLSVKASVGRAKVNFEGTHRPEGFFVLNGPHVITARQNAQLLDIAPTLLAAMEQPVPIDMKGTIHADFFSQPLQITRAPAAAIVNPGASVYTDAERQIVEQRLADLGYDD